jgi:hypothetical protein
MVKLTVSRQARIVFFLHAEAVFEGCGTTQDAWESTDQAFDTPQRDSAPGGNFGVGRWMEP